MYFHNRAAAGRLLAEKLVGYQTKNTVVIALSPGAVIVGAQIAMKIHANLMLLLTENVYLPGEHDPLATLSSTGTYTYNNMFSAGEIEELTAEYREYIAEQRLNIMHRINALMSKEGEISRDYLRRRVVIVVSDGMPNGFSLNIVADFLKPVSIKKLVVAVPIASIEAIDKMHLMSDQIICLSSTKSYVSTNHYYDDNTVPPVKDIFKIIRNISVHWDRPREKATH